MLVTADDQSDPLVEVVDHVGDQEDWRAVAAGDDEVLDRRVRERRLTPDQVYDDRLALGGRAEPQRPTLHVLQAPVPAEAVVAEVLRTGPFLELLTGAVAVVRAALRVELLGGLAVTVGVLRLEVRTLEGGSALEMPMDASALMMPSIHCGLLRAASVSSIRRTNLPPTVVRRPSCREPTGPRQHGTFQWETGRNARVWRRQAYRQPTDFQRALGSARAITVFSSTGDFAMPSD